MDELYFLFGTVFGLGTFALLSFSEIGPVRRRSYRLGYRHGRAQSSLPPYLEDLSE